MGIDQRKKITVGLREGVGGPEGAWIGVTVEGISRQVVTKEWFHPDYYLKELRERQAEKRRRGK